MGGKRYPIVAQVPREPAPAPLALASCPAAYSRVTGESEVTTVDLSQAAEFDDARCRPPRVPRRQAGNWQTRQARTKVGANFGFTSTGVGITAARPDATGNRVPLPIRRQSWRKRVSATGSAADRVRLLSAGLVTCGMACSANIVVDFSQIWRLWKNVPRHSAKQSGPAVASALKSDRRG